jgi:hypothetical protein
MMKEVDAKKNPGLAKLSKKVRNKMGFMKDGGEVKYEYRGGGEVDLEKIADDIRQTMKDQKIQEGIDSTSPEGEDAIFSKRKKAKTYMGGGMVEYRHGGDVSSGKGCGIATSGRKFSGTF